MLKFPIRQKIKRDAIFPQPLELESKQDYLNRVKSDPFIIQKLGVDNILGPASREWQKAKERSLVSITTSEGQFLMFGAVTQNW